MIYIAYSKRKLPMEVRVILFVSHKIYFRRILLHHTYLNSSSWFLILLNVFFLSAFNSKWNFTLETIESSQFSPILKHDQGQRISKIFATIQVFTFSLWRIWTSDFRRRFWFFVSLYIGSLENFSFLTVCNANTQCFWIPTTNTRNEIGMCCYKITMDSVFTRRFLRSRTARPPFFSLLREKSLIIFERYFLRFSILILPIIID